MKKVKRIERERERECAQQRGKATAPNGSLSFEPPCPLLQRIPSLGRHHLNILRQNKLRRDKQELVVVKEKPELEDEYGDQTTRPPDQKDVKLRVHGLMLMTRTWIGSSWREAFNCKLNKVEKSSALEATCSEESSKMLLRHEEGLQSFVFHPGETREVMIYLMARSGTLELNYQGSVILQSLDLRTNPFKGGGDGVILIRIGINGLKPMYGSAIPLIMVQFNGQYHTLIGMIYEVLDREKRRTVGTALKQLEQRGFNQLSLTGAMETIHLIQICMENKENMSGSFWIGLYLDLGEIGLFRSKKRVAARILIHLLSSWPNRTLGSLIWCVISRSEALEYQEASHLSCVPHQSTNLDTDRVFDSLFARIISHPIALRRRPYPSPFIHPRPLQVIQGETAIPGLHQVVSEPLEVNKLYSMSGYEEELTIPFFYGKIDTEAYLDWEKKMEFLFGLLYYTEKKKVCLAVNGLCGSAFSWWQRVSQTRRFEKKPQIISWVEMKTLMKKRFVSQWKLSKLKPEAATKLTILDQPAYWSELPLKPAERRSVVPVLSLKQEEEKQQASILASPIQQIEESHKTEPEPTTLCLKLEEEAEVAEAECGHVPDQIKQEEKVPGGSSKALELVLPTVEQGDNFKSLACELLIRPLVCLQLSLVEHLRVVKGLQQVVFEPGGSLCVVRRNKQILDQKATAYKLNLQGSFTLEKQDLWSNLFKGRENGMIKTICRENEGESGGNTSFIRFITDQNKLRRDKQELVVVKEKPELEDEYGDQTTRPPDQKDVKLRVHGLMLMTRTWIGSSWREAFNCKLNKVEKSSALEATCSEESSKMLLRHEEGLQSFVFHPGETREVLDREKRRTVGTALKQLEQRGFNQLSLTGAMETIHLIQICMENKENMSGSFWIGLYLDLGEIGLFRSKKRVAARILIHLLSSWPNRTLGSLIWCAISRSEALEYQETSHLSCVPHQSTNLDTDRVFDSLSKEKTISITFHPPTPPSSDPGRDSHSRAAPSGNGMIKTICRENEGESGGNTSFIRFITDQNKLRRDKQELVVVKEKPELEDEYGDQTTRPPDQKDVKLRVHGLMLMTRTWIGSSWREAFNCKLNKVEKSSALEATCSEESSKMLLRHEEGLQSFVFHPGETREVLDREKRRTVGTALKQLEQRGFNQLSLTGAMETIHLIQICMENKENMSGSFWIGLYLDLGEIGLFRSKKRVAARILIHLLSSWPNRTLGSLIWCVISRSEALEYQEASHLSCVPHQSTNLDTDRVFDSLFARIISHPIALRRRPYPSPFIHPRPLQVIQGETAIPGLHQVVSEPLEVNKLYSMSGYEEELTIPFFYGKIDTEAYLDWEKKMEFLFGLLYYTEKKKVCLAVNGLCGSAFSWWQRVSQTRRFEKKPQIISWVEMKTLMRKRFVSQWKLSKLKPEAATKLTILDQPAYWSELPLKPAERRSVVPVLSLKQEEEKQQASILASPIKQIEESHKTEPEPTTLCLKLEEEAEVAEAECGHVPDQIKQEEKVPGGSSKALELVLPTVEQGDNFKSLACELLIRPLVCLQLSLVEHLRVVKGLQQVVFEPGGSLFITDQNKLRRDKQELVVVKEKPELEDEYGDQTTRPPDQKDVKLRVHGLMLMTRTWIGSSWREAFNCKLNKVEKSSALEATCSEESSKMLLRHEEGLQSFVFHPGETREVLDREKRRTVGTALKQLEQRGFNQLSLTGAMETIHLIQICMENKENMSGSFWIGLYLDLGEIGLFRSKKRVAARILIHLLSSWPNRTWRI
ncbi:hypothetical protein IGI04_036012 [Brassica rapa subsp. trilocularis]|uniref:Uncharacterized protein n=1 Tax=Brassica rapa subsp. trilocularis TaxID=1813537 RepID=A0ABQ7LD83_BRACM|nr:hypothetical protein IGI04_036012 [Brassica rapa subsp. trilocularis]